MPLLALIVFHKEMSCQKEKKIINFTPFAHAMYSFAFDFYTSYSQLAFAKALGIVFFVKCDVAQLLHRFFVLCFVFTNS